MIKQFLTCSQEAPVKQDIAKFFLWHGEVNWLACIAGEENRRFSYTKKLKIQTMRFLSCFLDTPTLQEYIHSFFVYDR